MLSWSSNDAGMDVDLTAVAGSSTVSDDQVPLDHAGALLAFATACAERDDVALSEARQALIDQTDLGFMVDAAGVAANFEMMTRLADGTGARMSPDWIEGSAATIGAMGVAELTSRR